MQGCQGSGTWLGAEVTTWRKTGMKKIQLCKAGCYHSSPMPCKAKSAWVHGGVRGLLPPCCPLLQVYLVYLRGLAHLPHISDEAELSVTVGVG